MNPNVQASASWLLAVLGGEVVEPNVGDVLLVGILAQPRIDQTP